MKDRDVLFHKKWLGLVQPIEGLVFSVPALADAQIAPEERSELSAAFEAQLEGDRPRIRSLESFLRDFLGYAQPGMLVPRAELPAELSFYAAEGGQEIRPSFALGRGPFVSEDPFAAFDEVPKPSTPVDVSAAKPWFALVWDLTEAGPDLDLDEPESVTGPWRYSPSAKLERLLRHVGIPIGLLFNGKHLRLVYAPTGESTGHLTFRVEHLRGPDGRTLLAALDLLLHARRAYSASPEHTLEGLLAESRRRQADVTEELAKQVFEAVEILVAGFEAAAARDCAGGKLDWLRPAIEAEGDHFYQGVLSVVLRLVFLLYAEDQALLPVEHRTYAEHLSLGGLYARLSHDAGAHPESMHHRFGAYGQLLALFRAVFFGVKHGTLELPPRRGRLFDPNTYPFLEGGLPGWTAAVTDPAARAEARPPSLDDGTVYRVMHRLVVFAGQRLSYRTLDVVQIGSVYESLMGYHVLRVESPAVRLGKYGTWVETQALRAMSPTDRARFLKETCGLNPGPVQAVEKAVKEAGKDDGALAEALAANASGRRGDVLRHRASTGRLVLQPGEERRRTGTHYTPPSLTEKVVRRTLEPLLACLGEARTPEQILQLKICDPAMGSGAFLVAACRELASEIVAAWTRRGEIARVIEKYGDAHLHARRLVAQQCLYGVDKNPAAVELAKLSLWLVTLSRTLPFTFVDHALRHGDSLVGLDFKQMEAFHWAPPGQVEMCRVLLREALDQAVELRQQILTLADHEDPASQAEKRRLFDFSQQAIDRVRIVADACVGAFFAEGKDAAREKERKRRLALVETWIGRERRAEDEARTEEERAADLAAATAAREELEPLAAEAREKLAPFHWWIEFPEVFFEERPDPLQGGEVNGAAQMEGVVGNPPFLGGTQISTTLGDVYLQWLLTSDERWNGKADLAASFFLRSDKLLGNVGALGLIATKSIAQSDTQRASLKPLTQHGYTIIYAVPSFDWPNEAAVTAAIVVMTKTLRSSTSPILNERAVEYIGSDLTAARERAEPVRLIANLDLAAFGASLKGEGFVIDSNEYKSLVGSQPRNAERLFCYIIGDDINSSPLHISDRYAISFGNLGLDECFRWPCLLRIVEERVRPYRETLREDAPAGRQRKKYWWRYGGNAADIHAKARAAKDCIVCSRVSKHSCFTFASSQQLYSEKVCIIATSARSVLGVLQSRVHEAWTWERSSTRRADLNYSTRDCFETFPFPKTDPCTVIPELESIGERLYNARAQFMIDTDQGLTKTYNALKNPACDDPRILDLRRLHEDMDRAVLAAYGWTDIAVPPYCPQSDSGREALQAFEDEVIDRLYVLNAERAREEQRLGLAGKKRGRAGNEDGDAADEVQNEALPPKKTGKVKKPSKGQGKLF